MTVGQRLCDALYAAGRIKEAGEALLNIVSFFDEGVYMAESVISWFSGRLCCLVPSLYTRHSATDFLQRCLSTENSYDTTLPTPPLNEWVKLQLRGCSWNDALAAAHDVTITLCSGIPRWPDALLVCSSRPRDSQFIRPFVIISKRSAR